MTKNEDKIAFSIPTESIDKLKELAKLEGTTVVNVLIQSINDKLFFSECKNRGAKILIEETNGKLSEVVRK